jgi:CheY-like chemotaxis protein
VSLAMADGARALVVLLIEDEFLVRCNAADCLRDAGYEVVETPSGEEAIALCKSSMSIDIVLFTDINLVGAVSGWDVAECFRINRPNVAVLYTSGKLVHAQQCVPGSEFVPKPYKSNDILNACQRLLGK